MHRLSWMGLSPLLCACVSTTSVVRTRFANEQSCPEDQVVVDDDGATHYRARGCEKEASYVCSAGAAASAGSIQCVEQGAPNPPGYREPDRPIVPPPDPRMPPAQ